MRLDLFPYFRYLLNVKTIVFLFSFLFAMSLKPVHCEGKPLVIAVLDTGFGYNGAGHEAKLCKYGHKDFSIDRQFAVGYDVRDALPYDSIGHGTNIVGLIEREMYGKNDNYCIVIIKYYSDSQTQRQNLQASRDALRYAADIKARFINYSGGGPEFDEYEYLAIKRFLKNGGIFVAAAGNENKNIDDVRNYYYPAKYDKRIIVVGNKTLYGTKAELSNYGNSITRWELGVNQTAYGVKMSGTSQATAVATGKLAASWDFSKSKTTCDR